MCIPYADTPEYPILILADFSIAKLQYNKTDKNEHRLNCAFGTDGYRAPEISNPDLHDHCLTDATDIWSLGMVIWNMMHTSLGRKRLNEIKATAVENAANFTDGDFFAQAHVPELESKYSGRPMEFFATVP